MQMQKMSRFCDRLCSVTMTHGVSEEMAAPSRLDRVKEIIGFSAMRFMPGDVAAPSPGMYRRACMVSTWSARGQHAVTSRPAHAHGCCLSSNPVEGKHWIRRATGVNV